MAIQTRRRARFRRATAGTQNLTTLIYNILKEQQAARKSAILAAFDANMSSKTYDSTYGGEPVDRAAVEALYNDMISVYPEGTTERDRLTAELNQFRTSAIRQEMNAYSDAYENGTYAFGKKITMNDYLAFLRDAKSTTSNEADKMQYTKEEFLVTFNDVSSDMKAKGASAGAFSRFYERQLQRAEEMGITKDSKTYRDIQGYLADASKAAAAEFKQKQLQDAVDLVSRRTTKLAASLISAAGEAVKQGLISENDLLSIRGNGDPMGVVSRWLSLGLSAKSGILNAGGDAGIMLGDQAFDANSIIDWVEKTRGGIQTIAKSSLADTDTKSRMMMYLNQYDAEVAGPMGLLNDLTEAELSSMNLTLDNERAFGNPAVNVDLYARHADKIANAVGADRMGRAFQDILKGNVPDGGKDFIDANGNPVKKLSDLSDKLVERLISTYTGTAFVFTGGDVDPQKFISGVITDYKGKALLDAGTGYLKIIPYGDSGVEVVVVDKIPDGIVTLAGGTNTDGATWTTLAKQQKVPVMTADGSQLGESFFEVNDKGQRILKFITNDNYTMDMDKYLRYLDGLGASTYDGPDAGSIVVSGLDEAGVRSAGLSAGIRSNPTYGKFLSTSTFNNIAKGPGYKDAVKIVARDVFSNLTLSGNLDVAFGLDASGNLVVRDEEAAFRATNLPASDILDIFNAENNSDIKKEVATRIIVRERGTDGGNLGSAKPETFKAADGTTSLTPTPAQDAERMNRAYIDASNYYDQVQANSRLKATLDEARKPQNVFFAAGLGSAGVYPQIAAPNGSPANPFAAQAEIAKAQMRIPGEIARSPYTGPAYAGAQPPTALDTNYAFRYATGTPAGTSLNAPLPSAFKGTSITGGAAFTAPSVAPVKFTAQQVSQSMVDFRAGERAPLGISSNTLTAK